MNYGGGGRSIKRRGIPSWKAGEVLDHVALLVVQEHEVVALQPSKSTFTPSGIYTCYVTSDSSGSNQDDDDNAADDNAADDNADDDNATSFNIDEKIALGPTHSRHLEGATLVVVGNPRRSKKILQPTIMKVTLLDHESNHDNSESEDEECVFDFLCKHVTVTMQAHLAKLEQYLKAARALSLTEMERKKRQKTLTHYRKNPRVRPWS